MLPIKVYFAEIDTKAIADYSRAIQFAPRVEYHVERGKIYLFLWQGEIKDFQYIRSNERTTDDEIRHTIDRLFIYNERFQAAERDFLKAIELSNDNEQRRRHASSCFSFAACAQTHLT